MISSDDIQPDRLIDRARTAAQLEDLGDTEFLDALTVLCRSIRDDRPRTQQGLERMSALLTRQLDTRLKLAATRQQYPEIARQEIRSPLILVGLPRSGTTILHALLAQDPAARSSQRWEMTYPFPPPRAETYETDPRIARVDAEIETFDPEFRAMHRMAANLPEECNSLVEASFRTMNYWANMALPSYAHWLVHEADMTPAYAFHRQFLQHLQAFNSRDYWVLKAPPHIFAMDVLLATYPDARIIMTHRDPRQVLPSNASLIAQVRRGAGAVDPKEIGADQLMWNVGLKRTMALRSRWPRPGQFLDTFYRDFISDPIVVVRQIYSHFQMELTPDAEQRMHLFLADNDKEKHGKHVYSAEQFGLEDETIAAQFAEYIDAFDLRN